MSDALAAIRTSELLRSPGGCALLIKAAEVGMSPPEIVEPVTAPHLVSSAIGEINPFKPDHDAMSSSFIAEGRQHRDLAARLVRESGIERWWFATASGADRTRRHTPVGTPASRGARMTAWCRTGRPSRTSGTASISRSGAT